MKLYLKINLLTNSKHNVTPMLKAAMRDINNSTLRYFRSVNLRYSSPSLYALNQDGAIKLSAWLAELKRSIF